MIQSNITRNKYNTTSGDMQYLKGDLLIKMKETPGYRISITRKSKGLNQSDVAEKLGLKPGAIGKWERDEAFPEVANLLKLSNILGCSIDYLLKGVTTRPPESNEIVDVLKGRVDDKEKLLHNAEEKINKLEEEVSRYQKKGQQKDIKGSSNSA